MSVCPVCRESVLTERPHQHSSAERDAELLAFIRSCVANLGRPPSTREIGEHFGLSSSSTTHNWLNRLKREGKLMSEPGKIRTLRVVS